MSYLSETINRNSRGHIFHNEVQAKLESLGFEYQGEGMTFSSLTNCKRKSIYREVLFENDVWHAPHHVDLLLTLNDKPLIIECKSQTLTGGSADVKLLEVVLNADSMRTPTILAYEGDKFSKKKLTWVRDYAKIEYPYFMGSYQNKEVEDFVTSYFS